MGFSERDSDVRVDFFRPSGKWYTTISVSMDEFYGLDPQDGVLRAIAKAGNQCADMNAVCLEPYSEHAFPIMLTPERRAQMTKELNGAEK